MAQKQTIDFSTNGPVATPNFSLPLYQGCGYRADFNCWQISYVGGFFQFNLSLPSARGVNLIFQLCSALVNGVSNCPINIQVNGQMLVSNFDPHNGNFYNMSWYIPASMLNAGNNNITLSLAGGTTVVFLKYATVEMFSMQQQVQTNWCWSAVATSTSLYYNSSSPWTQCSLANNALHETTCCTTGGSTVCNVPWYLDGALNITGNFVSRTDSSVSFGTVQQQAVVAQPLGARQAWQGGGAHFMMVTGVGTPNNVQMVAVEDPWSGPSYITYSSFVSGYQGSGDWTHTYFTKSN